MTPEEFRNKMAKIVTQLENTEDKHADADDLMCKVLIELGYEEGVKIFENMEKWYS